MENSWTSKIVRTLTSAFPVQKGRKGSCKRCGECCKLPNKCIFLGYNRGKVICKIYAFRPLSCKKYPRTKKEHLTKERCGYYF